MDEAETWASEMSLRRQDSDDEKDEDEFSFSPSSPPSLKTSPLPPLGQRVRLTVTSIYGSRRYLRGAWMAGTSTSQVRGRLEVTNLQDFGFWGLEFTLDRGGGG